MRLLSIRTFEFQDFRVQDAPPYAIASHRWGADETTYKDFKKRRNPGTAGFKKIGRFCGTVKLMNDKVQTSAAWTAMGLNLACEWLWIDTACINKTDSVELSESINSMFEFYRASAVCYAYLPDVRSIKDYHGAMLDFMQSTWFTRGWTLQELLAPQVVIFLTSDWEVLGHKCSHDKRLCDVICRGFCQRLDFVVSRITNIPLAVIKNYAMARDLSAETKMSWIRKRETTKIEDLAYCLLGICDVFLVPIYGEGHFAWKRMQAAIAEKEALRKELKDAADVPRIPRSSAPLVSVSPSAAEYIRHQEIRGYPIPVLTWTRYFVSQIALHCWRVPIQHESQY